MANLKARSGNAGEVLIAFDLGSSKLRLAAGEVAPDGAVRLIYFKEAPSFGINSGAVSDLSALAEALKFLAQDFESVTGIKITRCIMGIAGRHIYSRNTHGTATVQGRMISLTEKNAAIENARSVKDMNEGGKHIIHVIPQQFAVDDNEVDNPIGLHALRLDVDVHLISCNKDQENNLRSAIARLSSEAAVEFTAYNGIAAADAVLTEDEKDIGVCLIDYGAGTVNVAVYERKKLILSFGLQRGGNEISRQIATRYGLPQLQAEKIKYKYGVAHRDLLNDNERNTIVGVSVRVDGVVEEKVEIPMDSLAELMTTYILDISHSVHDFIEAYTRSAGMVLNLGAGIVLTGGMANVRGIDRLFSSSFSSSYVKVKIGTPRQVEKAESLDLGPESAVAIGLLRCAREKLNERQSVADENAGKGVGRNVLDRIRRWIRTEL